MTNVQSVITPATNGAIPPVTVAKTKLAKTRGNFKGSPSTKTMTVAQAIEAAFQYGASMAGMDGNLTIALKAFKDDDAVQVDMLEALNVGYMMRKLDYDKAEATRVVGLLKYNEKKEDDEHRTFEQQRIMDTVRVLWHRATKNAGIVKPKSDNQVKAEVTRAEKEAEKAERESRLIKADEIINPASDVDAFDALSRLVLTMKSLQSKYSAKLVGERGSTWRKWLASAPK